MSYQYIAPIKPPGNCVLPGLRLWNFLPYLESGGRASETENNKTKGMIQQ